MCIGSANDCLALDALSTAMKREGVDMGFDICFNCEAQVALVARMGFLHCEFVL